MMTQERKEAVYVIHPDGTGLTRLDSGPAASYSTGWSPDGRKIAYLRGDSPELARLTVMDYDSREVVQVDFPGVTTYTWSPDGQRLAFTTEPETQGGDYYIYIVSLSDLKLEPLYKMPHNKRIVDLDWSPRGDKILAQWQDPTIPVMYLRLFSLSGEYTTIDNKELSVYDATWDSTGEWIAFVGKKPPEWTGEMWVTSVDNEQVRRILENQDVFSVDWSPDGRFLAYSNGCCGNPSGISVIDLKTQAIQQIKPLNAFAYSYGWSPDGSYLAYLKATEDIATKQYSLNIYSFATSKTTQIVKEMVTIGPTWRP